MDRVKILAETKWFALRQAAALMGEFSLPEDPTGSAVNTVFFEMDAHCKAGKFPGAVKIGEGKNAVFKIDRESWAGWCKREGYRVPSFLE